MVDVEETEQLLQAALAACSRMRSGLAAAGPVDPGPLQAALAVLARRPPPPRLRPLLLGLLDELVPLRERLAEEIGSSARRLGQLDAHRKAGRAYRRRGPG